MHHAYPINAMLNRRYVDFLERGLRNQQDCLLNDGKNNNHC